MGVKSFDVMAFGKAKLMNPEELGYKDSIEIISDELHKTRKSFVKIGWYLKHIRDNQMYVEDGYTNIYALAMDKFRISQPTATRFIQVCEEFSVDHNSPELDPKYEEFSVSQLFELISMQESRREEISADMTVKQIRAIKSEGKENVENHSVNVTDDDNVPGQTSIENDFPMYMPDDSYTTSHTEKDDVYDIEGTFREVMEADTLPLLKNNEQRKAWLADYKKWGLWYTDKNIDVNYYKYDFVDGSRLIVAEYPQRFAYWSTEYRDEYYYHLLEQNKKGYSTTYNETYRNNTDSETYLVEFLKNLQK